MSDLYLRVEFTDDPQNSHVLVVNDEGDILGRLSRVQGVGVDLGVGRRPLTTLKMHGVVWEPAG